MSGLLKQTQLTSFRGQTDCMPLSLKVDGDAEDASFSPHIYTEQMIFFSRKMPASELNREKKQVNSAAMGKWLIQLELQVAGVIDRNKNKWFKLLIGGGSYETSPVY